MINVGKFRNKIKIVRLETIMDDMGSNTQEEIVRYELKAEYQALSGKEFYSNNALDGEITAKFLMRKRDIDQFKDYVIYNKQKYDIYFVQPIDNSFIKLHCKYKRGQYVTTD